MSVAAPPPAALAYAPPLAVSLERLRGALLWLTGLAGAFVFMEPSPYEIASLLTMTVFVFTGLALTSAITPLIVMLMLYNIGYSVAVVPVIDQSKPLIWVLVSIYLSIGAIFFAAAMGANTSQRLNLLVRGYMLGAAIAAAAGILAYFHLLGGLSETFMRYARARGTFNDPNVLGAFLIFPSLIALQRILIGTPTQVIRATLLLGLFILALLVTFSRAAWGQFAGTTALLMLLTFLTTRSNNERLRIVVIAVVGVVVLALFVAALLSIDRIAELFKERASLEQSYDVGRFGRFGRYSLGAQLALERPFGIGPLQFAKYFPEDPHNTFLNAFMSGGWLTGMVYPTMILATIVAGFRFVFVATPWRKEYMAVYCAFFGVACESAIIDIDHWRHFFLLLGLMWGLMAASRRYRRGLSSGSTVPAATVLASLPGRPLPAR
jgi:hypothetical protein